MSGWPTRAGVVLVSGTDTGVGKTMVTAAVAAGATAGGYPTAVLKPAQTGTAGPDEADADTVARLAAPALVRTLASYPDPLAPPAAARVSGRAELALGEVTDAVDQLRRSYPLVLVEGAGGLLVPLGERGWTLADLAVALGVPVVVVVRPGLGTLNHTALTLEALARRGVPARVVVGSWPARPELVHRLNLTDLPGELAGVLPEGAGTLPPDRFRAAAPGWLAPALYGTVDPARLRSAPPDPGPW